MIQDEILRGALEPFVQVANSRAWRDGRLVVPGDNEAFPAGPLTWGHLRRLASAVEGLSAESARPVTNEDMEAIWHAVQVGAYGVSVRRSGDQPEAHAEATEIAQAVMSYLPAVWSAAVPVSARSGVGGEDSSRPGSPCADAQDRTDLARPEGGPCVGDPEAAAGDAGVRSAGAGGGIGAAAPAFRLALRRTREQPRSTAAPCPPTGVAEVVGPGGIAPPPALEGPPPATRYGVIPRARP